MQVLSLGFGGWSWGFGCWNVTLDVLIQMFNSEHNHHRAQLRADPLKSKLDVHGLNCCQAEPVQKLG